MTATPTFNRPTTAASFATVTASNLATTGPLASNTLASPAASITFTAIAGSYSVLHLIVVGASTAVAESDRWSISINGTAGANYDFQHVSGSNTTAAAAARNAYASWVTSAGAPPGDMPGASASSGVAGILEITIPNYAGTIFQKVGIWRSGYSDAATAAADQESSAGIVAWRSTAAITQIVIAAASASNLATGTSAYLYGY